MHNGRFFSGGPHKNNLYTNLTHALIYLLFVWYFLTGKERIPKSLDVNNFETLWKLSESPHSFVFSIWQKKATSNKSVKLSVHWGINPFLKNTTFLFLAKPPPPIKSTTIQAPLPRKSLPLYWFFVNPRPQSWIFQWTSKILKFFILVTISSLKSN